MLIYTTPTTEPRHQGATQHEEYRRTQYQIGHDAFEPIRTDPEQEPSAERPTGQTRQGEPDQPGAGTRQLLTIADDTAYRSGEEAHCTGGVGDERGNAECYDGGEGDQRAGTGDRVDGTPDRRDDQREDELGWAQLAVFPERCLQAIEVGCFGQAFPFLPRLFVTTRYRSAVKRR
jgi:hypothetical protein